MKLSILIPTQKNEYRQACLSRLLHCLEPQLTPDIEIHTDDRDGLTTGAKRNALVRNANGLYVQHVDDDDLLVGNALELILEALAYRPDVVGFKVHRFVDGKLDGEAIHSIRFKADGNGYDAYRKFWHYQRVPNHLNPVKRELALAVGFPDKTTQEDCEYAAQLRPMLKTERFISQHLYLYLKWNLPCHQIPLNWTPCLAKSSNLAQS